MITFKKFRRRCLRFIINIGTSGKYKGEISFGISDYLIRYVLMNFITVFGSVILAAFAVVNYRKEWYFTSFACVGMIIVVLPCFALARTKVRQIVPALILMIFYSLFCVMITWTGEADGANFLFIYMYPSLTIMLLGMRYGVTLSAILGTLISLEMFVPNLSRFNYQFDFSIRMLVNYILVFSVMIVIESTRNTKDRLIENQSRRLQELRDEAQAANRTKSNFLASMSHEIRTPMNAITGMSELLLRGELSDEARGYAQDIKQAGSNLISIINDILDFSKIEAGKLEILPVKYLLASLVNDTVNIIRTRLMEKPIRFYTNIDGNIPNSLIGDEVRLRQIFLNLLSNAVKYTDRGYISLTITMERREDKQVRLRITVTDTGKGIKPEDQEKLFGDFVQVDAKKNRGIEGTGLGLAITRRLSLAMGGNISMESEYGKGSAFTVIIPQGIELDVPFAVVNEPEQKKVLVYEGRAVYAKSICWSLENMCVPYTMVTTLNDFAEALHREEWFYVFSGYGLYERIKPAMEGLSFPNGRKPPLALMVEFGTETYIPNIRFVSIPIQSLSIANLLNGRADHRGYYESSGSSNIVRFTFPEARLLVVDDIATNLKVAEGLLAPYRTTIDTSLDGMQAIEMVKRHEYDIVFMDHMMPEMDGIETTAAIRALEGKRFRTMPIIALTANAVFGMREMFIEKGFNDFLAKPIDVSKLDEMLARWIPKGKRETRTEDHRETESSASTRDSLSIPGVDTAKGITMTGGTEALYRQVLALFCRDAQERLPLLQTMPEADVLPAFITQAHALKSASASLGAAEVSAEAALLEAAGKAGDMVFIRENLGGFTDHLAELIGAIEKLSPVAPEKPESGTDNHAVALPLLRELAAVLKAQNISEIDRILDTLGKNQLDFKTKEAVEKISNDVLMTEYANAIETIRSLIEV